MADDTTIHRPGAHKEATYDTNALFRDLRDRWYAAKKGRNGTALVEFLGVRKQLVSCYGTGSDNRSAPWWVLVRLCDDLGLELRVNGDHVVIARRRWNKERTSDLRKGDVAYDWQLPA